MSFTRLTVRTRIACILLPLVAVIVALTVMEVRERLDQSSAAAAESDLVDVVAGAADLAATHARLALAAVDGAEAAAQPAAEEARAGLDAVVGGPPGEDPLVAEAAAELAPALSRFDAAVAELAGSRDAAALAGLALATEDLLGSTQGLAVAGAARVGAGGASLDPALALLQAHDAATVLGLLLAAGADGDVLVAADRLDAALARAEVFERGSPGGVTADLRDGVLSAGSVALVAEGGTADDGLPGAVAELVAPVAAAVADDLAVQLQTVQDARDDARRSALTLALGAAAVLVVALGLALVVVRSITAPLRELTASIDDVTTKRLPRLVDRLRSPDAVPGIADELTPVPVRSDDEIGRLAVACNALQQVTAEVAEQQAALLRTGISDLFVHLARRNQALIERQLRFIDELEAHEEDPEQLRTLFELDHLATRLRRNAESLLVIAGSSPGRRPGAGVPMADVVRIAASEIEQYRRVVATGLEEAYVGATVAADLAHLLAELLDNATAFSAPDAEVEVIGQRTGATYLVCITDRGDGIVPWRLAELNAGLVRPPAVGLDGARTLGLTVVARLAHRHGIAVRLVAEEDGGLTAQVRLPAAVLEAAPVLPPAVTAPGRSPVTPPPPPGPSPVADRVPVPVGAARAGTWDDDTVTPDELGFAPGSAYQPAPLPVRPVPVPQATSPSPERPAGEPIRRSPEDVRRTLSRYRGGLARGRGADGRPGDEGPTADRAVNQ